jgi:hypothetical protein
MLSGMAGLKHKQRRDAIRRKSKAACGEAAAFDQGGI